MPCGGVPGGDFDDRVDDVRGGDRLKAGGGQADGGVVGGLGQDGVHDLEELVGAHDGVWRGPLAEQVLLQRLGAVVVQLGHLVHADDEEDHLVPDTGAVTPWGALSVGRDGQAHAPV